MGQSSLLKPLPLSGWGKPTFRTHPLLLGWLRHWSCELVCNICVCVELEIGDNNLKYVNTLKYLDIFLKMNRRIQDTRVLRSKFCRSLNGIYSNCSSKMSEIVLIELVNYFVCPLWLIAQNLSVVTRKLLLNWVLVGIKSLEKVSHYLLGLLFSLFHMLTQSYTPNIYIPHPYTVYCW